MKKQIICFFTHHQWALRYKVENGERQLKIICNRCGSTLDLRGGKTGLRPRNAKTPAEAGQIAEASGLFEQDGDENVV